MTRNEALKLARSKVGRITRHASITYTLDAPASDSAPDGVRKTTSASTYADIMAYRALTVARIALRLLGIKRPQIEYGPDGRTIDQLVAAGLRKAQG